MSFSSKPTMIRRVVRSAAVAIALAGIGGVSIGIFDYLQQRQAVETKERMRIAAEAVRRNTIEIYKDKAYAAALRPGGRIPASEWLARERAFYSKILAAGRFDVVVLPALPLDYAFDRATRSVVTARLAEVIGRAQNAKVADPSLVAKALGEGGRELDPSAAYALANDVGAKGVVWVFVGHDRKGKMGVSIQAQDRPDGTPPTRWATPVQRADFQNVAFDDDAPPLEALERLLPDAIKVLGGDPAKVSSERPLRRLGLVELGDSPVTVCAGDDNAACDAYVYLLLARLVPSYVETTRDRFVAKAYLATLRMSHESPEWRALRARTYLALGYRPAALKAVATPQTDEERAVLALVNGNLPELRAAAGRESNPLKRTLAHLDANAIGWTYGVATQGETLDMVKAMNLTGGVWPYLVRRGATGLDAWARFPNVELKRLLDKAFPVSGHGLLEVVGGSLAIGDAAKVEGRVDTSVVDHGRKFIAAAAATWCCPARSDRPDASDYLELLQAIGHDNVIRDIHFLAAVQGRPDEAMTFANAVEAAYQGDPYYTLARARVERALSMQESGAAVDGLLRSSVEHASHALLWEQSQSRTSAKASELLTASRQPGVVVDNPYVTDVPYRPLYPTRGGGQAWIRAYTEAALRNSAWNLEPVRQLLWMFTELQDDPGAVDALVAAMTGRFAGSPERSAIVASIAVRRGDVQGAAAAYREGIKVAPDSWESYSALGKILLHSGSVGEAASIYSSYPGFRHDSEGNRVGIANAAYEAGSAFYWSGHLDIARRFYEIAAGTRTGAAAEMASAARLRLLAGDYASALAYTLQRAQRYHDATAYRDYLGMLHATGQSKDAWAGFMVLVPQLRQPQLWETALVGHHLAGASEADVVRWVRQQAFEGLGRERSARAAYLLRFATTDRVPSGGLAALLDELDFPTSANGSGQIVRESHAYAAGLIVGMPRRSPGTTAPPMDSRAKTRVMSDLAFFAEGYRGIKTGDFAAATTAFEKAAALYDMEASFASYMLPYYALAAAKGGDTGPVETILARFKEPDKLFDYHLAKAAIAAIAGDATEALAALKRARYSRPFTDERPLLTQYTYGDLCEMLAAATGNAAYRQLALSWAKDNQVVEPWHAWSYAMESRLLSEARDRQRSIAMLRYLDPNAARLTELRSPEVNAAARAWERSNPFRLDSRGGKKAPSA